MLCYESSPWGPPLSRTRALPDADFAGFPIDDGLLSTRLRDWLPRFASYPTNQRNRTLAPVTRISMQTIPEFDPAGSLMHAPAARMLDHVRPYRVHLDVAVARQDILLRLHQARAKPTFPQRAAAFVHPVHVLHVALAEKFHQERRCVGKIRTYQQMKVVGQWGLSLRSCRTGTRMPRRPVRAKA